MKLLEYILKLIENLFASADKGEEEKPNDKVVEKSPKQATNQPSNKRKARLVVIDPGHGGTDTGATYIDKSTGTAILEKKAALETALTLKYILTSKYGWKVLLTRTGDVRPKYSDRTGLANRNRADAFVSIHFNSPGTYGLVYYAAEKTRPASKKLAEIINKYMGFNKIWKSTQSRFGRLYIDDVDPNIPSVLVEVDPIDGYEGTKEYRLKKANEIAKALDEFFFEEENGRI